MSSSSLFKFVNFLLPDLPLFLLFFKASNIVFKAFDDLGMFDFGKAADSMSFIFAIASSINDISAFVLLI